MHVSVVERRELIDHIAGTRSVARYEYRDGHYDGDEREFRGFGQVDVYDADAADGMQPGSGAPAFAAPALTRTWFHLGTPMWNEVPMGSSESEVTQLCSQAVKSRPCGQSQWRPAC